MRIRSPGRVRDRLWYLGHEESGIYLLEGQHESIVISGGMSYLCPTVMGQFDEFGIEKERIKKLLILHAHFDHIGVVPFFKRCRPELEVYASARAWEILRTPKAINTINEFSRRVAERIGMGEVSLKYDVDWRRDIAGTTVSEGDVLRVDNFDLEILETPGHSSCSITAYVPQIKALFPSDAGGVPYKDMIITSGNSNYTAFQRSLEKLEGLEVDYLCADHYGYVIGDEARTFISCAIAQARERRAEIEEVYSHTKDIDATVKELIDSLYAEHPDYFLSPEILAGVYRQMVRHIVAGIQIKSPVPPRVG
jgi:glyoxylase-like metal-dependent hydrolase (beta-lactamase superfamily II)